MKARPVYTKSSWRIAMRCVNRQFLLTPTEQVVAAVGYCLAIACNKHGILLHALSCMSNHLHLDITDPDGNLSAFRRDFKSLLARCLNCHYDRWEYFWAPRDGMQEVSTEAAAINGMAYTITNPVAAGLVASPAAWPGLTTLLEHLGTTQKACAVRTFRKPNFFFRHEDDGPLPDAAVLFISPHPLADDAETFLAKLKKRVRTIIAEKVAEVRAAHGTFAGAKAVLAHHHSDTPNTREEHRTLNPRFAEPDTNRRICRLVKYTAWLCEYAEALRLWRDTGKATFPAGTNKMRDFPGVTVRTE